MKDNGQHGEYLAPEVKVIEIKSQRVLCVSGDEFLSIPDDDSGSFIIEPW